MGSQQKKKKRTKDTRSMSSEIKRAQDLDQNRLAIQSNLEAGYSPLGVGTISFIDVSTSINSSQTNAPAPPPQVTGVTASPKAGSDTQIVISWSATSTALTYNVYVSTQNGFTPGPSNLVTNTAALTYTATGLIPGTVYYVKVAALNALGAGTASAQASTTTTGTAPPPPTLTYRFKLPFEESLTPVPTAQISGSGSGYGYGGGGSSKFGHAHVYFNNGGDTNAQLDLADNSSPEVLLPIPSTGSTFSLWIWPYVVTNLTNERVIATAANINDSWIVYMRDGRIGVYMTRVSPSSYVGRKVHQTVLVPNTWYHIAFTWDNSLTGDNKIKLYVDKVLDNGQNTPQNNLNWAAGTSEWIGALGYLPGTGNQDTTWYGGLIDELQKWDGIANQSQIDNLFATNHPSGTAQPAQITGLTVTPQAGSDTQLNLAWTASGASGLIEYVIYRSTINGFTIFGDKVATSATNSYSDTGRVQGTTYYYRVAAVNHVAEGVASAQVSGTTTGTVPLLPQIKLPWDNSLTDASGFTPLPTPLGGFAYTTPGKFGAAALDPDTRLSYTHQDRFSMLTKNKATISFWIYPTDISSTGMRRFLAGKIDNMVGSPGAYTVFAGWDISISSGGTVRATVRFDDAQPDMQASVGGFVVNQWQMITVTIDLATREVNIYRNATIAGADSSSSSQWPTLTSLSDNKLEFGYMLGEPTDTLYVGSLDEFQFYDVILTSAQILNLYNTNAP